MSMLIQPWRIEMLGSFCACLESTRITRFKSHNAAALLAYLALFPSHPHSRDELVTLLWPDDDSDAARNRFRVMLNSLRRQLEPPGMPPGGILLADRLTVALQTRALTTDVGEFEEAADSATHATEEQAQIALLRRAAEAYRGELLPGFLDDWVLVERSRLAERYQLVLHRLVRSLAAANEPEAALNYALQAVQADPLREESCRDAMRLYDALGQPSAALHRYAELERLLLQELGERPGTATRQLATRIAERLGHGVTIVPGVCAGPEPPTTPIPVTAQEQPAEMPCLPIPLTRFFGREPEIAALLARLEGRAGGEPTRLLTLIGVGGAGKTRLAIETARRWQTTSEGATRFVSLADLSASRQIPAAIAAAMRLMLAPGQDPLAQVCGALAAQRTLLVLDNLEHLAAEAAPLITCLVTSRRSLGVEGEEEWPVAPLPVPASKDEGGRKSRSDLDSDESASSSFIPNPGSPNHFGDRCAISSLLAYPSVQLFVDRAQAVLPHFQVTARNAQDVAALCRDLEGI